jgi:uncharacterized membrane protein YoaK (UPF0700 family)
MASDSIKLEMTKTGVAVVLTFVAGYVDAVGWLSLDHVFTAQMSGNTVQFAIRLVGGSGDAWLQGTSILAFFAGLVISGSIIEIGMRQHVRRILVAALAVELPLLGFFSLAAGGLSHTGDPDRRVYELIAIVAFAMGTQNTSLRMAGILSVFTTHVTGAVSSLSEELIICGFVWLQPRRRRGGGAGFASGHLRGRHRKAAANALRSAMLLAGFFGGALAGAALFYPAGLPGVMFVPFGLLIGVGIFDWILPLTVFPSAAERE